jgi:hypothetical protein
MQANYSGLPFLQHLQRQPMLTADAWLTAAERFIADHPLGPDALQLLTIIAALYLAGLAHAPQPMATDDLMTDAEDFTRPDNFADFMAAQGLEDE